MKAAAHSDRDYSTQAARILMLTSAGEEVSGTLGIINCLFP